MVGIDIGSHEVKAILLSKKERSYHIVRHAAIPLMKGTVVDREIKDLKALVDALSLIKRALPKNIKFAAVAVSGSAVINKVIEMDASLTEAEMEAQIELEAESLIPYPLNEISIDFELLDLEKIEDDNVEVLLSACRTDTIDSRIDALDDVNLEAKVVDIEGYALGRTYEFIRHQLPNEGYHSVTAMIDVGANMLTLAMIEEGETVFVRGQDTGGDAYTQAIMSTYGLTYDKAEKAKILGELPLAYKEEVLLPFQMQLLQKIKHILQLYYTVSERERIDYIVLCGGGACIEGLVERIKVDLNIDTMIADPFTGHLEASSPIKKQLQSQMAKYMLACGLALRSYGQWPI
ncbi:pilus assembly protein PilM [Shewanella surugensis]|uniref:Pilus assembly protein PilM n=2 Tax=Shewanella surugensis TaxID=212020 RepID=A0ABT0LDB7_9GAMM|nr:type IV pilus assembly protein PilM [Shewanella surugensis]MCL1125559.1 pilus assembly protein PilM [Shewanella surugensis]